MRIPEHGEVMDIGGSGLRDLMREKLKTILEDRPKGGKVTTLPDELLYCGDGLFGWDEIISTPAFYQTHDEIAIFDNHGSDLVEHLQGEKKWTILDLGSGDTRKVEHLLRAFETAQVPVTYLALDISEESLQHNIEFLATEHPASSYVKCAGLWGTFTDGMKLFREIQSPRLILSLGSVLCNDPWHQAVDHLKYWSEALRPDDLMLVGMDGHTCPDNADKIWKAYHTSPELFERFFLKGFAHANELADKEWFKKADWEFRADLEHEPSTRHRPYMRARHDIKLAGNERLIKKGEDFDWFDAHKYNEQDVLLMGQMAGLEAQNVWQAPASEFRQYLFQRKRGAGSDDGTDSGVSDVR